VDREWVSVRLRCHRDQAATCVAVFTDVLTAPRFVATDVSRLRDEALYELTEGYLGDEEELGREVLDDWLYEAHPYGHPRPGRAGTVPLLDDTRTRDFYARHYVRGAVIAGIAGDYDDALRETLLRAFDALAPKPAADLVLMPALPVEGRRLLAIDTATDVTGFSLGHPWKISRSHPDFPALYLAMTAFGAHRQSSGRLFRVLRTERGLNYGTYAYAEPFVQRGWEPLPEQGVSRRQGRFSLWIRPTALENGAFALKLAIDELERLALDGLSPEEFDATRAYLLGHLPLEAPDAGRRLAYALDAAAGGTPDMAVALPEAIAALTLEDVNEAIQYWIRPQDLRIVAVSGDAEALAASLLEDTATPIVYNDVTPDEAQATRDAEVAQKHLGLTDARVLPAEGIFR